MNTYNITIWLAESKTKLEHTVIAKNRKDALRASQGLVDTVFKCESVVIGYSRPIC